MRSTSLQLHFEKCNFSKNRDNGPHRLGREIPLKLRLDFDPLLNSYATEADKFWSNVVIFLGSRYLFRYLGLMFKS